MSSHESFIHGPHGRIHLRRWNESGTRTPVILLHDSLGCTALWRDFPARLAQETGRQIISYDRSGYGQSDPRTEPLRAPDFVTDEASGDFAAILAALHISDFTLMGHSIGASMGIEIAIAMPDRCKSLICMSAQVFDDPVTLEGIRRSRDLFRRPEVFARLQHYHGNKTQWALDGWVNNWLDGPLEGWNQDASIARLRCPTMVIHGGKDEYGRIDHARRIKANATQPVRLQILDQADHFPHRSQPQQVLAAVTDFLKDKS